MVKICPKCGKENPDEASYCLHCGAQLGAAPSAPVAKPPPTVTVTKPPVTAKPVPTAPAVTAPRLPTVTSTIIRPPGMCFYHPQIPAKYICSRCGRPICENCATEIGGLILCPQCAAGIAPIRGRSYWWIAVIVGVAIAAAIAFVILFFPTVP
ncbi:MAG: hypothetical protein DRJ40_09140 [Thermoprotei archaeon]|nr:MAG: hypothetical protein DRJ40_09140 [Thermoprotei archaeon]